MNDKPIFDAIRRVVGRPLTQGEVDLIKLAIAEATGIIARHVVRNPAAFYARVRAITGRLEQTQVDAIEAILAAGGLWPLSWVAYALATAWHEARFIPQREWGRGKGRPYAAPGKYNQPQYGRGLVQLTWDRNYEWADKALGLDGKLLANFDLALEPTIAVRILMQGMKDGAFTGRSLQSYLPDWKATRDQFANARRIVNGTDKADLIAGHAINFQIALIEGDWNDEEQKP
jgi:putative chitinase